MTDLKLIWREAMARASELYVGEQTAKGYRSGLNDELFPKLTPEALAIYTDLVREGWEPEAAVDQLVAKIADLLVECLPGALGTTWRGSLEATAEALIKAVRAEEQAKAHEALTFIADLPDPGEEQERSATFYRIHIANLKHIAAKALGRQTVSDEALAWADEQAKAQPAEVETYRQMHATAIELGYEDILDALEALAELKAAAQPAEVVAWMYDTHLGQKFVSTFRRTHYDGFPLTAETALYAHPAQPTDHDDPMEVAREVWRRYCVERGYTGSTEATALSIQALARVLPPMRIADLGEVKP